MKAKYLILTIFITTLIISCNSTDNDESTNSNGTDSSMVDTTQMYGMLIDTTSSLPDSLLEAGYVEETEEIATEIEKKYGVQWDFCDCVVKNDSIQKAINNSNDLSDEEFDALFARLDVIDNHCKELITTPNTTPEERDRHKRKVRKCLKEAGIK